MHAVPVLGFLLAVAPITLTPGTSLTLVVARVTARGKRHGWWVILGTVTGLYVHATMAGVGLAALVLRSSQAFEVVKLIGAGYLAGLGLWMMWSAGRGRPTDRPEPGHRTRLPWSAGRGRPTDRPGAGRPRLPWSASRDRTTRGTARKDRPAPPWRGQHTVVHAFLGNVLNPKAAGIYLTLAPQFLPAGRPVLPTMLLLATAHAVLHTCWLAGWTTASGAGARFLRTATARRAFHRLAGAVLLGLGVRAALD